MKLRRRSVFIVLAGLIAFGLAEVGSFAVLLYAKKHEAAFLLYRVPQTQAREYEAYRAQQHPRLGWPAIHGGVPSPRRSTAFPSTTEACLSLYGDSFARGDEVGDEETWAEILSRHLGCPVRNWGISGYGLDQATLLHEMNKDDRAPLTIMAIWPGQIMRIVNRWQYLMTIADQGELSFKPRLILEGGTLKYLPAPDFPFESYLRCAAQPENCLTNEVFLPDTTYGSVRQEFPNTRTALRLVTKPYVVDYLRDRAGFESFLNPDHEARPLSREILRSFKYETGARGQHPWIVVFPTVGSMRIFIKTGRLATQPLIDDARELGLTVLDLHAPLTAQLREGDFCGLLSSVTRCGGHFNVRGNQLLAEIMASAITSRPELRSRL